MTALIQLNKLTKDYGQFRALNEVDLSIGEGITGLLGPNGAGKSTLIKVLLGLVSTTSGDGHVLGHQLGTESGAIRSEVGFMPEDDCFMHGLSGIESVQVAARLSRLPSTEALRRGHEILDFCGMGQERYRNVETYSTGMRQKLRFAMAIVHDPRLLILDEPTSGLDPEEREAMLNRIRILSQKFGKAVILCTHILPDVQMICENVVILAAGRVKLSSPLQTLLQPSSPGLTLRVAGDSTELRKCLADGGDRSEVMANGEIRVMGSDTELNQRVWKSARETATSIQNLISAESSLEEIFLKAVRETHHANS